MPSTSLSASQGMDSPMPAAVSAKSATAYRTISEAADMLGVPQHVLRFWETKFPQIRPMKRSGGRRYYRPQDIATLQTIQNLLYAQGYTIKGVQRLLKARHNPADLADMGDHAMNRALDTAAPEGSSPDLPDLADSLDSIVDEVSMTATELNAPSMLAQAMADVLAEIPHHIPAHLPAGPASLMAAGLEAGRPLPAILSNPHSNIMLANAVSEPAPGHTGGLAIEQRLRLECLLEELLALKAEFL